MINVAANCEEYSGFNTGVNSNDPFGNNVNFNTQMIAGNTCTLSEQFLRSAPFGLPEEASVNCQVVASNVMGDSQACAGAGAIMPVLATLPDPCQNLRFVSRDSE
jgi:hypothetical protein